MIHRRQLLGAAVAGVAVAWLPRADATLIATPVQTAGPFYPERIPDESDADLMRNGGVEAEGQAVVLSGRVLDINGRPLAEVQVEIWQCDARGRYHHVLDEGATRRDERFQGYGRVRTGGDGAYRFRTLKPVPYATRTPHIHFRVVSADGRELTTQLYVQGEPQNQRDFLYRSLGAREAQAAETPFLRSGDRASPWTARFDLVLG